MDRKAAKWLLLISFAVETFSATYGLAAGTAAFAASIGYLAGGLGLVVALLFLDEARLPTGIGRGRGAVWIKFGLAAAMIFLAFISARYWIEQIPVDPDFADMLPVIKVMNERFLSGHWQQVYQPIPEIWQGMIPGYLPAMWLPYGPAVWLNLDMRWVTVLAILLSFSVFLFFLRMNRRDFSVYLLTGLAAMLFWWIFSRDDVHGLISLSEEGPVILYYVLLCVAIVSRNIYFIALSASLCLLSRYGAIGWVLPLLIFLISRGAFRRALIFCLIGGLVFLLFFLIPFGASPVWQLAQLPARYVPFAAKVWTDTPEVFWLNLGLAKFFGPQRTLLLHRLLIGGSFGLPVVFMLIVLVRKKRKLNNLLLATLKLSLLVFYQFIDVPYGYLFYTPVFVSLMIAALVLGPAPAPGLAYQSPDSNMR